MRRPRGFSLIELIVVVLIIGALMAILLPTLAAALRAGKRASVASEIQGFVQGIAAFQLAHASIPPSLLLCSESGDYSAATLAGPGPLRDQLAQGRYGVPWAKLSGADQATLSGVVAQLANRSLTSLRQLWPRVVFAQVPVRNVPGVGFYDFNGNGVLDPPYLLDGTECLVFFLGGIAKSAPGPDGQFQGAMIGFARDSRNPFQPDSYTDAAGNIQVPSRLPAQVEFRSERLVDSDGDGVPWYADSYSGSSNPTPYAYFATTGDGLYDPHDVDLVTEPDGEPSPIAAFTTLGTGYEPSRAPNPYSGTPVLAVVGDYRTGPLDTSSSAGKAFSTGWLNPSSYQLISAGDDRRFGPGGWWNARVNDGRLPFPKLANATTTGAAVSDDQVRSGNDNVTNFSGGPLD